MQRADFKDSVRTELKQIKINIDHYNAMQKQESEMSK